MAIEEGKKAPDFSLPASGGKTVKLSSYLGKKNVILYFYPKDNTPGCTQESCDFRDAVKPIAKLDGEVLGISADSVASHEKFAAKFGFPFLLLSDEDKEVLKLYGVWKKKSMYGKEYMGIERTTVVIDKKGIVRKIFPKVKVTGHVQEVQEVLASI